MSKSITWYLIQQKFFKINCFNLSTLTLFSIQRFSFNFIIVLNQKRQIGSTKTLLLHDPHFLIFKLVTNQKLSRSTTKTSCQQIGSELAPCYCDGLAKKRIIHDHNKTKLISFKLPPLPPRSPSPPSMNAFLFFLFRVYVAQSLRLT